VGSREYPALRDVDNLVNHLHRTDVVVSGGGRGVDLRAERAARRRGLGTDIYLAAWKREDGTVDRGAGFKRNQHIVDASDAVIAFWDGASKGTADTLRKALAAGKPAYIVSPGGSIVKDQAAVAALVGKGGRR
jgi:predicted Rossmann-fold nucleotide-binding protein